MKVNTITNVGQTHLNAAVGGGTPITIKSIVLGDGSVATLEEAKALTAIKGVKKVASSLTISTETGTIKIHAPIDNIGIDVGFKIREIGIIIADANGADSLFWYVNYDEDCSFMSPNSSGLVRTDLNFDIVIDNDSVEFVNSGDDTKIFATKLYVDKEIENLANSVNDLVDINKATYLKKVCLYYGYPNAICGSWNVDNSINIYKDYDIVVFGDNYNDPTHEAHADMVLIINGLKAKYPKIQIFGYVPCAAQGGTKNLTTEQIKAEIDKWAALKITGVFLDEFGYDYWNTRLRQNEIITHARTHKQLVFVNSWEDKYVFSNANMTISWMPGFIPNPDSTPAIISNKDYSLYENLFWDAHTGTQKHQEPWVIYKAWDYYCKEQTEFGGKTYWQQYGTQTISLDGILNSTPEALRKEYMSISILMARMLNINGVAFGDENWGSRGDFYRWDLPLLNLKRSDTIDRARVTFMNPGDGYPCEYLSFINGDTYQAYWTENNMDMSTGVRMVRKNGDTQKDIWVSDLDKTLANKLDKREGGVVEKKTVFKEGIGVGPNSEINIEYSSVLGVMINGIPFPANQKIKHIVRIDETNSNPSTCVNSNLNLKIVPQRTDLSQDEINPFKLLDMYPFNKIGRCLVDKQTTEILAFFEDLNTDLVKFGFDPAKHEICSYIPAFYANRFWEGEIKTNEILYNVIPDVRYYKGLEVPPAFIDADGSVMPYILYGSFKGSEVGGQLRSIPNVEPKTGDRIGTFRDLARSGRDIRFNLEVVDDVSVVQFLYEIAFQDLNSQKILGDGWTNKSASTNTGGTLTLGNRSGCLVNGNQVSLFGIEDFYGNIWSFVDGAVVKDNGIFYTMNPNDYGDRYNVHIVFTPPMGVNSGEQQNGYVKNIQKIDGFINYPKEVSESSSTYYTDYHWSHKRGQSNSFLFGTRWDKGSQSGCFSWGCVGVFSIAYSDVGGRLVIKPRKLLVA